MRRMALGSCLAAALIAAVGSTSASAATLSPSSANFGSQTVGTTSAPRSFTLTPELLDLLTLTVATTGDFSQTNNCQAVLQLAAGPCTINVTFKPSATGNRSGTLSTTTPVLGGPSASLSGTGTDRSGGPGQGGGQQAKKCKKKGKKKGTKKGKKRAAAAKKKGKKKGKKCKKGKKKGKGKKK
jgi:hypothetical protein